MRPTTLTPAATISRRSVAATLLTAGGALAAACRIGGSGQVTADLPRPSAGPVTLEFMHYWGTERAPMLEKVYASFMQRFPNVTVKDVYPGSSTVVLAQFRTRAAAGSPPDVIMHLRQYIPALAEEGTIAVLDPWMARDKVAAAQFYESDFKQGQWQGKTYALPMLTTGADGVALYNVPHLAEAGASADRPPATWPEYQALARRLTNDRRWGGNVRDGINGFLLYLLAHKGKYISDDGRKFLFGDAKGLDVFTLMSTFYDALGGFDAYQAWRRTVPSGNENHPFITGALATDQGAGSHIPYYIHQYNPTLPYRVAVPPNFPGEAPQAVSRTGHAYTLAKDTPYAHEAWQLLSHMTASKEITGWFAVDQGRVSARKDDNKSAGPIPAVVWNSLIKAAEQSIAVPFTPVEQAAGTIIGNAVTAVQQKRQSPREALDEAVRASQVELDQYWARRK